MLDGQVNALKLEALQQCPFPIGSEMPYLGVQTTFMMTAVTPISKEFV